MCCTVAFVCQVIECQVNPVLILVTEFCIYCKVESGPARNICFSTVTVIFCTRGSTNKNIRDYVGLTHHKSMFQPYTSVYRWFTCISCF
ncbi:hypothetical protein A1WI_04077 [Escherichia coli KTE98]|nr:hypothetical protein A1WI_04077 [Escherichia coli KTE98]